MTDSENTEDAQNLNESGEDPLNEDDVYEYLIDKVSAPNRGLNRDLRSLNSQTSYVHLPPGNRGSDVRIRVNTSNFNRLRSVFTHSPSNFNSRYHV